MRIVIDIDTDDTAAQHCVAPTVTVHRGASDADLDAATDDIDAGAAGANADNQPAPADEHGVDAGPAPEF